MVTRLPARFALLLFAAAPVFADDTDTPVRVRTVASVAISDGSEFEAVMEYETPLRASYEQHYSDLTMHFETDGDSVSVLRNEVEVESVPAGLGTWILGHQFHAQLLRFAELNDGIASEIPYSGEGDCRCVELRGNRSGEGMGIEGYGLVINGETGRPQRFLVHRAEQDPVVARFEDWRDVESRNLPYRIVVDDGEAVFDFRFDSVEIG